MEEIKIKGVVKEEDGWYLETNNKIYSPDILAGIDEILQGNKQEVLHYDDEVEIIIKINRTESEV